MVKTILEETETKFSFITPILLRKYPRATIRKTGATRVNEKIKFCNLYPD